MADRMAGAPGGNSGRGRGSVAPGRPIRDGIAAARERHALRRRLVPSLPEGTDASATRDGIGTRPPAPALGARAWLLTQLIAAAPLTEWVTRLGLDAGQIVSLPVEGGLGVDVHAGWRLAAISQASTEWAGALLAAGPPGNANRRPPAAWPQDSQLTAVLRPDARAARAATLLAGAALTPDAVAEVASCPGPWPDSLADLVIAVLRRTITSAASRWPEGLVSAAARNLPAPARATMPLPWRGWPTPTAALRSGGRRCAAPPA